MSSQGPLGIAPGLQWFVYLGSILWRSSSVLDFSLCSCFVRSFTMDSRLLVYFSIMDSMLSITEIVLKFIKWGCFFYWKKFKLSSSSKCCSETKLQRAVYCLKIKTKNSYLGEEPLDPLHFIARCQWCLNVFFFDDQKRDITALSTNKRTLKVKSRLHNCVFRCRQS